MRDLPIPPSVSLAYSLAPRDPPDVVLIDKEGRRHGIEVTELVDEDTVRAWHQGLSDTAKEYSRDELHELVSVRIRRKSCKPFYSGPFVSKCLLIYSDEPSVAFAGLTYERLRFPSFERGSFTEAWFLIPPAINTSGDFQVNSCCRAFSIPLL